MYKTKCNKELYIIKNRQPYQESILLKFYDDCLKISGHLNVYVNNAVKTTGSN